MDMPRSRFRRRSSSSIWAWMVTSRAVVGSSASRSFGRGRMAAAIMARCSMPPDSSWGYFRYTSSASGRSTSRRACRASSRRFPGGRSVCTRRHSSTWGPMRMVGSMALIGSWNTTQMSRPWMLRRVSPLLVSRSRPSSRICPRNDACSGRSRPEIIMAVTVLPLPDSPTSPTISPSPTVRSMPRTASWSDPWNCTCRSRISSIPSPPPLLSLEPLAQQADA